MSNSINNPKMKKSIFTILSITILILAWQLLTMLVRLPELVPSIPHLFSTLVALFASGSFYQSVMATVLRGTIGMSISLMAAMGVSLLFYKCEWIYELFRPLLAIMRSIPVISLYSCFDFPECGKYSFDNRFSDHVPTPYGKPDERNTRTEERVFDNGSSI